MPRKISTKKKFPKKDFKYNNFLVALLVNKLMKNGKKSIAKKIIYKSFSYLEQQLKKDPILVLEKAIRNISPRVYLKPKYIREKTYQVPVLLNRFKSTIIAIKWLVEFSKKRKKNSMTNNLSYELIDAWKGIGTIIKKKEEVHKMAEANKAFLSLNEKK
jgi:small subunit ribosomal protein S7